MSLKLKKARSVVMDLSGVVVTRGYMTSSPEAKNFMRDHLKQYLKEEWGKRSVRQDLELIRKKQEIRSREHNAKKPPPVVEHTSPILEQYNSLINNIIWRLENEDNDPDPGILASFHINFNDWASRKGILRTPWVLSACSIKWLIDSCTSSPQSLWGSGKRTETMEGFRDQIVHHFRISRVFENSFIQDNSRRSSSRE